MAAKSTDSEIFAVNYAALAREIAMDILPVQQILELHRLSDEEWEAIQRNKLFQDQVAQLTRDWTSAGNTRERVKMKAATGLESVLEQYVVEIADPSIPLIQRVEAGKFLARLGELDGSAVVGAAGERFVINLNIGNTHSTIEAKIPKTIDGDVVRDGVIPDEEDAA